MIPVTCFPVELRDALVILETASAVFALCLLFFPRFFGLFIHREMGCIWLDLTLNFGQNYTNLTKIHEILGCHGMPHLQRTHLFQLSTGTARPGDSRCRAPNLRLAGSAAVDQRRKQLWIDSDGGNLHSHWLIMVNG